MRPRCARHFNAGHGTWRPCQPKSWERLQRDSGLRPFSYWGPRGLSGSTPSSRASRHTAQIFGGPDHRIHEREEFDMDRTECRTQDAKFPAPQVLGPRIFRHDRYLAEQQLLAVLRREHDVVLALPSRVIKMIVLCFHHGLLEGSWRFPKETS